MGNVRWLRWSAGALVASGIGWLLAGVLIVWQPFGIGAQGVYSTLVPLMLVALVGGVAGLKAWLGGFAPKARRRGLFRGYAAGLEAMSSQRHRAVASAGAGDDGDRLTARGFGVGALRVGAVVVIASSLLMGSGTGLRSTLFFGWFVFFAGALVIGLAVLFAEDLPRGAGALLAVGSLLVLSVATVAVGGGAARPEALGPLLPFSGGVRVVGVLLWTISGAAWAWLGAALWIQTPSASGRGEARRRDGRLTSSPRTATG